MTKTYREYTYMQICTQYIQLYTVQCTVFGACKFCVLINSTYCILYIYKNRLIVNKSNKTVKRNLKSVN